MPKPIVLQKSRRKPISAKTKTAPAKKKQERVAHPISPETRTKMICEAAYYISEREGFPQGRSEQHWLQAEEQIDAALVAQATAGTA